MHRILTGIALMTTLVAASVATGSAQMYGGGNGLPQGSYQQSCTNLSMNGSTLTGSCTNSSGQRVYSSVDVNRCGGSGITNNNGYLSCNGNNGYNNNGYSNNGNVHRQHGHHRNRNNDGDDNNNQGNNGYNNGYGNNGYGNNGYYNNGNGLPPGSYQQSCSNLTMNGSTLSGSCTSASGQRVYSSLNVSRCMSRGANVVNIDGRLRCG
jgi:hypothetical protein